MEEFLNSKFIAGFCKVEFLCYAGDPNWLGWIVLGVLGFAILILVGIVLTRMAGS